MSNYNKYITENFFIEGNIFTYTIDNSVSTTNFSNNDYLHKIFVKLKLPAIYSSSERQFKWIKYLGYNIIKSVKCTIKFNNSTTTTKDLYTYTEWLYIWNEINLSEEEKKIHYMLIGHTPELYDPALHNNNTYPVSHLNKKTYDWIINDTNTSQASYVTINNDYNYNKPPSIPETTLYIPLNFYFCNDINNILPLQNVMNIKINITFRPVNELYTVLLVPEDFVLNETTQNVSNTNFNNNIKLPSNINFTNNKIPNFTSNAHLESNSNIDNLSIFDVLLNKYRIKPLTTGNTAINNFILDPSSNPLNNNISNRSTNVNSLKIFYDNICDANISYNIINSNIPSKNKIKLTGLLNPVDSINVLNTSTYNDGSVKEARFIIIKKILNRISDQFFIIRHAERENKNDLLNFTNLDYNNTLEWDINSKKNNTISYSSNIELLSNSVWEHESTNSSIKIGINNIGVFYIKKHIQEDNVFKYVDILNYKSDNNNTIKNSIYNSNSSNIINEKILDKFKITIEDKTNQKFTITNQAESYNFYNKITLYKKYNNSIKGLYYINNTYNGLNNLEISLCNYNKININGSEEYKLLLFCIENVNIELN